MGEAARRLATYADIEALPPQLVGEIIDGELFAMPRPAPRHAMAQVQIAGWSNARFHLGDGGPGGWWILPEPELHLRADVVVPDIACWRKTRLLELPEAAFFTLAPDWVCEVLSPSTERIDRIRKMKIYAREGVGFVWLLKPSDKSLEVFKLHDGQWLLINSHEDDEVVRVPPFEEAELDMKLLWA